MLLEHADPAVSNWVWYKPSDLLRTIVADSEVKCKLLFCGPFISAHIARVNLAIGSMVRKSLFGKIVA